MVKVHCRRRANLGDAKPAAAPRGSVRARATCLAPDAPCATFPGPGMGGRGDPGSSEAVRFAPGPPRHDRNPCGACGLRLLPLRRRIRKPLALGDSRLRAAVHGRSTLLVFGLRARSSIAGEPAIAPRDAHRGHMNSVHHEIARGTFMVMPPIPPGIGTLHPKVVQSVRTDVPAELERASLTGAFAKVSRRIRWCPGSRGPSGFSSSS